MRWQIWCRYSGGNGDKWGVMEGIMVVVGSSSEGNGGCSDGGRNSGGSSDAEFTGVIPLLCFFLTRQNILTFAIF